MSKNAREEVVDLLMKVEKELSYAQLALKEALNNVEAIDKGFITEVFYGTLKYQIKLDYIINQFSKTPVRKMKPLVRNLMRMSVYQLFYLDKVPASAVINEAVKIAKKRKFVNLAGFINGVLRTIDRERDQITYPSKAAETSAYLSIYYAMPQWIVEEWLKQYAVEDVEAMCAALNERAKVCGRYNPLVSNSKEAVMHQLQEEGVIVEESAYLEEAFYLRKLDNLQNLASFKTGAWTVQDESAMLVAHVVAPKPGEVVLDMCSAPGGKSKIGRAHV